MHEHRSLDPKGAALALLLASLWGANPVAIKLGLADVAPLQVYRPSALSAVALTTPIWGVLIAAAIGGEGLAPELIVSTLLVVAGIALTMGR